MFDFEHIKEQIFSWSQYTQFQVHIKYLPIGLPIASLDFRNLNTNTNTNTYNRLDFHKAASRYIEKRIKENA